MSGLAALEFRWIDAWGDLAELTARQRAARCLLPDGRVVDAEACRGWLQASVYDGWEVGVSSGWVLGTPGVIASRWRTEATESGAP